MTDAVTYKYLVAPLHQGPARRARPDSRAQAAGN